jgi:hypothetical protein
MEVSYNGITFSMVKTNDMSFTPVWSEDGTTYLYTRVFIDVEGILNPEAMAYTRPGGDETPTPGALPPRTIVSVRHALEQPRAQLLITNVGDTNDPLITVVESPASGFSVDCNNGPKPGLVRVSNFHGARTWYIHWTCETWIHECPDEDSIDGPILSNRYSQEDQIDEQWLSTRVTTGVTVFRTDILYDAGQTADDFRSLVIPPTPRGFQRKRINVTIVPNLNALHWSVTDQEMMYDKGDTQATNTFITEVQGTYGISSLATDQGIPGGQSLGHLFIRIKGDKRASNWIMTQRAFALAAGKVPLGSVTEGHLLQISVNQSLVDRDISLNVVYKYTPQANAIMGSLSLDSLRVDSIFPNFGGVNPEPPWGKGTQGTSALKVLGAALEAACTGGAAPEGNFPGPVGGIGFQDGPLPVTSISTSDTLPSYQTSYSTEGQTNPYNVYDMTTRYYRNSGIIQAPIAGPASSSGGSSSTPTSAFFRVSQPTSTVTVKWSAERVGATPQIPAPDNNNTNYVLLDHSITPIAPQVLPDGNTYVFRVEGEYFYGCKVPMRLNENLAMGAVPWIATDFIDINITSDDYYHNIIDSTSSSTSFNG